MAACDDSADRLRAAAEQERILTAWDVEEVDAQLFRGMSATAIALARQLTHPPPSIVHSVALIVNALAKVGFHDKEVFVALSALLLRAPAGKGEGSLRYDAQAVSNIVNAFAKANMRDERYLLLLLLPLPHSHSHSHSHTHSYSYSFSYSYSVSSSYSYYTHTCTYS
jgi:hypothetical protein